MLRTLLISALVVTLAARDTGTNERVISADAGKIAASLLSYPTGNAAPAGWFHRASDKADVPPPNTLAVIACRVERKSEAKGGAAERAHRIEWRLPLECMRVVETVRDAAALSNLWLRERNPDLSEHSVCAEIVMTYAPIWEASHNNWAIVKVGCPTKIVDASGRVIGWHMPECQGTIPGTTYPLRCRFDPSEV